MAKKNKISEFEESIEKSSKKLTWVFDILSLAIDDMKSSISKIFMWGKKKDFFITLEMEKFEKEVLKDYNK